MASLLTCTIKSPPFSYAHIHLLASPPATLDTLLVKSYCLAALRQFLGLHGAAVSLDVLLVRGDEAWVRVPREDLPTFAAAVTAWKGAEGGVLRVMGCSDWLGSMVGSFDQDRLWASS